MNKKYFFIVFCSFLVISFSGTVLAANNQPAKTNFFQSIINLFTRGKAELVPTVEGTCGSANGTTVSSIPTTNLCATGTPSEIFGSGPWFWNCDGTKTGWVTSNTCKAEYLTTGSIKLTSPTGGEKWEIGKSYTVTWEASNLKNVDVNITNNKSYSCGQGEVSAESNQLTFTLSKHCKSASFSSAEKYMEAGNHTVILYAHDLNGKIVTATMEAGKTISIIEEEALSSTDGECGSASGLAVSSIPTTNLCATGTPSGVSGSGPWTWSCAGSNGGKITTCFTTKTETEGFIKILNPKAGEKLQQGSIYTMNYSSSGYSSTTSFPVYLSGNNNLYRLLGKVYPSKNSFSFTVPSDLSGSGFQLDIPGESNTEVFSIILPTGTSVDNYSKFAASEVVEDNLPESITFWTTANCPTASSFPYVIPDGYRADRCENGPIGSHGGCSFCAMSKIKLVKSSVAECVKENQSISVTPIGFTQSCCSGLTLCSPSAGIVGSRGTCKKSCEIEKYKTITSSTPGISATPEKPLNQMSREELINFLIKLIQLLLNGSNTTAISSNGSSNQNTSNLNPTAEVKIDENGEAETFCRKSSLGTVVIEDGKKYCSLSQEVFKLGCGGTYGEGGEDCLDSGKGSSVLTLPLNFGKVVLKSVLFDDSGTLLVNNENVYDTGSGCSHKITANKDITSYVYSGENDITALVNNDCGLSMSAKIEIKYELK